MTINDARCVHPRDRAQELCESRGGRPGLPVPNSPYGLCGRKATLKNRAQELCKSRGGRPRRPVPNKPTVFVDVKQHFISSTPESSEPVWPSGKALGW